MIYLLDYPIVLFFNFFIDFSVFNTAFDVESESFPLNVLQVEKYV